MKTAFLYAHRRSIPLLTAAGLALALTAAVAAETWDDRFGVPNLNNQLFALDVSASETVAIGGSFSGNSAGNPGALNANKVALWNGASWSTLGTGPDHGPGGPVHAVKWLGNELYVGGEFPGANNLPANHLIRWDGSSWHPLVAGGVTGLNGSVHALATAGDHLYVAGRFTTAGPVVANCVARWDGTTWSALGGGISGGATPVVTALAVAPDGSVYVGGMFTSASGVPAVNIARWDGSSWSPLGTGITGPGAIVRAIAVASNGDVVAGGNFTTAGGQPAQNLARWNGSTWQEVVGGVQEGEVLALAYDGDDLWVGGTFTKANTYIVPYLGVLQNGIWQIPGIQGVNGEVRQIVVRPAGVYLVGFFQNAGDRTGLLSMAKWDRTEFQALHRGFVGGDGYPNDISAAGTNVIAVGSFESVGGRPARGVARWDGTEWQLLGTPQNSGVTWPQLPITALALPSGEAYVGGAFSQIAGVGAWNIARWNGNFWQALGSGVQDGSNTRVNAIVQLPDGSLVAGGTFLTAGGQPAKNIARWDGENWSPLAEGLHWSFDTSRGDVLALAWAGDRLYAAGGFDRSGALAVNAIAWWDGLNWHALDGGVTFQGTYGSVQAVAVHGFEVFVGGAISQAGSVPASWIARWQPGTGWSALGAGLDSGTDALLMHGGTLYVAGNFNNSGGVLRPGLAGWDGTNWHTIGGGLVGLGPYANSLAASGTNLYIGGGFDGAGSVVSTKFARLNLTNAPPTVAWQSPAAGGYIPTGGEIELEVNPDDADGFIASVQFFKEGNTTPLATLDSAPWQFTYAGAPAGPHRFAALVTDDSGATTWSLVRRVQVLPPGGSIPPQVTMTTPTNGASFKITTEHLLSADASDPDGSVVQVDFTAGDSTLISVQQPPWQAFWPDIQPGNYQLRAVAWDNSGDKSTSAVVNVTVLPPNQPPEVQITDPSDYAEHEAPGPVLLRALSGDHDGRLTLVEFHLNDELLVSFTEDLARYTFYHVWEPSTPGEHVFRVASTDNDGTVTELTRVFPVAPFNEPPTISWVSPPDGSSLGLPNNVPLVVEAADADGSISKVEWLRNETIIGSKTSPPWVFSLRNLTQNTYLLRARTTDNLGKTAITPVVSIVATNDPAQVPRYKLVDLDPPQGNGGEATALNQLGVVVSSVADATGYDQAYRYQEGSLTSISAAVIPPVDKPMYARGVNDAGTIIGYIKNTPWVDEAYSWTASGLNPLGFLGDPNQYRIFSRANGINNHGWIVGVSVTSNNVDHAFLWRDGSMIDLGSVNSMSSEALAINDVGQVVGWLYDNATAEAFLYDDAEGLRSLGTFGGEASKATAINNHGQIVGEMYPGGDYVHSFLWSQGQVVQLGLLGGRYARAKGVNDRGQVVGSAEDINARERAFLWQDCAMIDLTQTITNTNWELRSANAINNRGWIAGVGLRDQEPYHRPVLLIPEDEDSQLTVGSPIRYVGGRFQLCVPVPPGTTYRLDASADLKSWTAISTNYVPEGVLDFRDPEADEHPTRFYRAVLVP